MAGRFESRGYCAVLISALKSTVHEEERPRLAQALQELAETKTLRMLPSESSPTRQAFMNLDGQCLVYFQEPDGEKNVRESLLMSHYDASPKLRIDDVGGAKARERTKARAMQIRLRFEREIDLLKKYSLKEFAGDFVKNPFEYCDLFNQGR